MFVGTPATLHKSRRCHSDRPSLRMLCSETSTPKLDSTVSLFDYLLMSGIIQEATIFAYYKLYNQNHSK